ncbi:hypothetical protein BCR34DRAFT_583395 [Clohesyomyces aquaticus]|uniref:Uncharacterized protein n=1 Tax=Clohesyomyces aquaticus TaxID=1231657 RepID=A0A1Y2A5R0_9PLEO|nr:hypothetical protein BCR34DRAFT_583395 [Clohesyomyces aquaticus]
MVGWSVGYSIVSSQSQRTGLVWPSGLACQMVWVEDLQTCRRTLVRSQLRTIGLSDHFQEKDTLLSFSADFVAVRLQTVGSSGVCATPIIQHSLRVFCVVWAKSAVLQSAACNQFSDMQIAHVKPKFGVCVCMTSSTLRCPASPRGILDPGTPSIYGAPISLGGAIGNHGTDWTYPADCSSSVWGAGAGTARIEAKVRSSGLVPRSGSFFPETPEDCA